MLAFRARYPMNVGTRRVEPGELVPEALEWPTLQREQEVNAGQMEPVVPDGQGGWRLGPMRAMRQIDGYAPGDVISEPESVPYFERFKAMRALVFVVEDLEETTPARPQQPRQHKKKRR